MPDKSTFSDVSIESKEILKRYEKNSSVVKEADDGRYLQGRYSERFKNDLRFGGVEIKKNYALFHLMPVYMYKNLVEKIPDNLKKECRENRVSISKKLIKSYSRNLPNIQISAAGNSANTAIILTAIAN